LLHKRHKKIVSQESLQRSCLAGIRKLLSLENFDRNCYTRKTRQLLHRGSLKLGAWQWSTCCCDFCFLFTRVGGREQIFLLWERLPGLGSKSDPCVGHCLMNAPGLTNLSLWVTVSCCICSNNRPSPWFPGGWSTPPLGSLPQWQANAAILKVDASDYCWWSLAAATRGHRLWCSLWGGLWPTHQLPFGSHIVSLNVLLISFIDLGIPFLSQVSCCCCCYSYVMQFFLSSENCWLIFPKR
jgi:hypothetical protein